MPNSTPAALTVAALCALILVAVSPPSIAQEQTGIAFAYAPEQGMGVCTGGSPEKALGCARSKCMESGALAEDCARVAWCYPGGWSVGVGIMHREGIHWTEFTCGWPTREAAVAAGKVRCEHQNKEFITDCVAAVVYDEQGNELPVE
jgi:hypothetical protein